MLSLLMRSRFSVLFVILSWMQVISVDGQCTLKSCTTYGDEVLSTCSQQNEVSQNFDQFDNRFSVLEHRIEQQGQFLDSQIKNQVAILGQNLTCHFMEHDGQIRQRFSALEHVKVLAEQASQIEILYQNNNNSEARIRNISEHLETHEVRFNQRLSVLEEHIEKQDKNVKALPGQIRNQIQILSQNISDRCETNDDHLGQSLRALEQHVKQQDQNVMKALHEKITGQATILRQNITNHLVQRIDQQGQILTNKLIRKVDILGQHVKDNDRNLTDRMEQVNDHLDQRLQVLEQVSEYQNNTLEDLSYRLERNDGYFQNISRVLTNKIISQAEILSQNVRDHGQNFTYRLREVKDQIDQRLRDLERRVEHQNQSLKALSNLLERHDGNLQSINRRLGEHDVLLRNIGDTLRQSSATNTVRRFSDCTDIRTYTNGYLSNGVYVILVNKSFTRANVSVYCEFSVSGESWLIFQRRHDGSVDFYRNYEEYSKGFGYLNGEFWLGNEILHFLTSKRNYKLRFELEDWEGNARYAEYSTFRIGSSTTNYRLTVSGYSGNAGDCFEYHNGQKFSAKDADRDLSSSHCAQKHHGGWWYNDCYHSNLNGMYNRPGVNDDKGLIWWKWLGSYYSLKKTKMKISATS